MSNLPSASLPGPQPLPGLAPAGSPDPADLLPARSYGYRLWMLCHAWTRQVEATLAPTGLTHMQFFILRATEHLSRSHPSRPHPSGGRALPSQTAIADGLHVDRMTVSKVVRTLEARGLLSRTVHPDDPRAKGVALTPAGTAAAAHATRLVHAEQERFFGRLGDRPKAAFSATLDALLAATPRALPCSDLPLQEPR